MAQLITVRLSKSDQQPLGFRLQGGKDFGTPLVVQKVNGGSSAERAGLQAGDALIRVNATDVYTLRHQEAQDAIRAAGASLELTVQRGGGTWRPQVTPTGSLPRPGSRPLGAAPSPVTTTSLRATPQPNRAFGSGHNNVAKPFGYTNGNDTKSIVNKQYNTPVNMYSDQTIAETLSAQTEVLAGGVLGVNFKKNEKTYDAEKSAVFKVLQEEENDPEPEVGGGAAPPTVAGLRHVPAPAPRPDQPVNNTGGLPPGQNICEECERLITGVFVRIKDKNLHVECFKCSTCGSSLKNQGYYNINQKLYCDIHAKLVARQNPPAPNLEPVTVPPGGRLPTNAYSTPLPPLATNNYTNGSSSMFSPSSNLSGPKPFGSSYGSAYSPSLSPRSAPLSPARPVQPPAPAPAHAPMPPFSASHAPAAPQPYAPTNEQNSASTLPRSEFKSAAEERLKRKIAKMALNGYEIGIQRRIKPADHIQSMAERIQDTVVSKHPINADSLSSSESSHSSREGTLKRTVNKPVDKIFKTADNIQRIGDKISETILNNHPATLNGNAPIPPPIPNTPIPTFNAHSTPIPPPMGDMFKKNNDSLTRDFSPNNTFDKYKFTNGKNHIDNNKNGYSSCEDLIADTKIDTNTLKKNNIFDKSPYLNDMNSTKLDSKKTEQKINNNYSNTLNKRNIFEKRDNNININMNGADKYNINDSKTLKNNIHNNTFEKSRTIDDEVDMKSNINKEEGLKNTSLPNNLYDNTLYSFRNGTNGTVNVKNAFNGSKVETNGKLNQENDENADESDIVVKRRQKKTDRDSDGRRDSHIVARPLSTMTAVDVADGQYPVCHVCEKAITRGPFITALGRIWCPEHFVCVNATCRRALQDIGFVEENGQLYCEYCFEQYIAPGCDKCHAKIKGDCLNAIGKHFHPECFNCVYCGKLFGNNPFFLEDGLPYCESDWNELFTTKCFACGFPVEAGDRWVEALNNNYHSQCFNCTVCKKNLEGQSFFAKGGRPFCKLHAR